MHAKHHPAAGVEPVTVYFVYRPDSYFFKGVETIEAASVSEKRVYFGNTSAPRHSADRHYFDTEAEAHEWLMKSLKSKLERAIGEVHKYEGMIEQYGGKS
jgi:hypothetical protein